eukprot:7752687-Pyramimonas_sp.AAC.1
MFPPPSWTRRAEAPGTPPPERAVHPYTIFIHAILALPTLAGRTRPSEWGVAILCNSPGFVPREKASPERQEAVRGSVSAPGGPVRGTWQANR